VIQAGGEGGIGPRPPLPAASSSARAGDRVSGTTGRQADRATGRRWPHRCGKVAGSGLDGGEVLVTGRGDDKSSLGSWLQRFRWRYPALGRCAAVIGSAFAQRAPGRGGWQEFQQGPRATERAGSSRRRWRRPDPSSGAGASGTKGGKGGKTRKL